MNKTNATIFIKDDMAEPISLGIISFFLNFFGYFLFYSINKNSIIASLIMLMFLSECICNFSLLAILIDIEHFIQYFKVKEIFEFLTFNSSSSLLNDKFLNRINVCLFNSFLNMNFALNMCYCYEVIQIFKNPISNAQARKTYYKIFSSGCLIASFIIKYTTFKDFSGNYNERLKQFWDSQ